MVYEPWKIRGRFGIAKPNEELSMSLSIMRMEILSTVTKERDKGKIFHSGYKLRVRPWSCIYWHWCGNWEIVLREEAKVQTEFIETEVTLLKGWRTRHSETNFHKHQFSKLRTSQEGPFAEEKLRDNLSLHWSYRVQSFWASEMKPWVSLELFLENVTLLNGKTAFFVHWMNRFSRPWVIHATWSGVAEGKECSGEVFGIGIMLCDS